MALEFKRSRQDMAHQRTFPNSKEEVIARTDVSNKNLLKNPFRTAGVAVGPVGVQNRPPNKMVDDRGAMYGGSVSVLRKDISNTNLLMNPYRFKTDPIDEPRTLSRQVIMDINSGKTPKYVRENKGIDEIAFMIVKALPDNGVKLATLSMLKSYITGMRLQSVLDQGGQNVVKAFDVLNQLVVTCTSLYKTGMLAMKLPGLLLQYSEDIAKVFNESVLQPVSPMLMFSAIQELASVSSVLTKLFRAQNSISTSTNVSIDEWARQEAAKLQAIRQQEAANTAPPVPVQVQQVTVAGDNQPTGTQGIKDADTIRQDGTGKKRKKKKLSEMMGGAQLNWGIAGTDNTQLTPSDKPSLIQNEPIISVNVTPSHGPSTGKSIFNDVAYYTLATAGVVGAVGAVAGTLYSGYKTINEVINKDAVIADLNAKQALANARETAREDREVKSFKLRKIELLVRPDMVFYDLRNTPYYDIFNRAYTQVIRGDPLTLDVDTERIIGANNVGALDAQKDDIHKLKMLADILVEKKEKIGLDVEEDRREREIAKRVEQAKTENAFKEIEKLKQEKKDTKQEGPKIKVSEAAAKGKVVADLASLKAMRWTPEEIYDATLGNDEMKISNLIEHYKNHPTGDIEYKNKLRTTLINLRSILNLSKLASKDLLIKQINDQIGLGKKRKSQKNIKSKIKKSKNLDAQILALLRA